MRIKNNPPCQSWEQGKQICKDGFMIGYPPSSACTGHVCDCCGRPNDRIPPCMDEDIAPIQIKEDGSPRLYRGPANEG